MRWIERLRRDDGRVKATPARVATSLADGVTRSTNLLRVRLEEQGLARADRKRFESEACALECLLFEWFLRDLVVGVEFGRHTGTIREALARRLADDLDRSGLSPAVLLDFARSSRARTSFRSGSRRKASPGRTRPGAGTDECLLECMIYEWFLRDIAGVGGTGGQAEGVRRAVAGRLLVDLQHSGLSPVCLLDLDRRHDERFREYAEGLEAS